jgi:hypothetical protein
MGGSFLATFCAIDLIFRYRIATIQTLASHSVIFSTRKLKNKAIFLNYEGWTAL